MRECDKQLLAERYLDLYKVAFDLLHSAADVEDAVQEALAKTFVRTLVADPYAYCVKVLRNECLNMLTRKRVVLKEDPYGQMAAEEEWDDEYDAQVARLAECRDALPQRSQQVLDLFVAKGCTMKEIAAQTGMSVPLVRKLIYSSYDRIREQMLGNKKTVKKTDYEQD